MYPVQRIDKSRSGLKHPWGALELATTSDCSGLLAQLSAFVLKPCSNAVAL